MGSVRSATGATVEALAAYELSLALARAVRSAQAAARALQSLGRLELDRGRLPAARVHLEAALREIEASRAQVVDPELRSAFFSGQQSAHELYVEILMRLARTAENLELGQREFVSRALIASERARARTLIDLLAEAGSGIYRGVDPESWCWGSATS